jgi:uroporphyrinogen-III synthase
MNAPTVLVTRAGEDAGELTTLLRAAGFEVRHAPAVERVLFPEVWAQALRDQVPALILLTSAATAELVGRGPALPSTTRLAAVGPRTAARARHLGLAVELVPETATGAALVAALGPLMDVTVHYPRAREATPETLAALRAAGASVIDPIVYENREPVAFAEHLRSALPVDLITLLSGSAARRVAAALPPDRRPPVIAIGPSTAAEARHAGLQVVGVADPHTAEGVAACAVAWWRAHDAWHPPARRA